MENANTETTCLEDMINFGIRGMEEDMLREYYKKQGVSEEEISNALELLHKFE